MPGERCRACLKTRVEPPDRICADCMDDARSRLHALPGLVEGAARLTDGYSRTSPGITTRTSPSAETPLQGGDTTSLLGPGNPPAPHHDSDLDTDPPSVLARLCWWERLWRTELGANGATDTPTIEGVARWLWNHVAWAGRHYPRFEDFATGLKDLHSRVEQAAVMTNRPRIAAAECFDHPGWRLAQPYLPAKTDPTRKTHDTKGGLADYWICTRPDCKRFYGAPEFYQARRAFSRKLEVQARRATLAKHARTDATVILAGVPKLKWEHYIDESGYA